MAEAPAVSAEIAAAYVKPCLPTNGSPALRRTHVAGRSVVTLSDIAASREKPGALKAGGGRKPRRPTLRYFTSRGPAAREYSFSCTTPSRRATSV
jgi:hypothetical protein